MSQEFGFGPVRAGIVVLYRLPVILEITGVGIAIAELKLGRRHEPIRADRESRSGN